MFRHAMYSRTLLILATLSLVILTGMNTASAQRVRQTPQDRAQHLKDLLSLTDDQTASVQAIYEKADVDMKAAADSAKATGASMRNVMRGINARTNASINQLLTDDQKSKFAEFQKKRGESQGRSPRRPQN
ncbi:MAG TPA: hypothetical protein VLY03_11555 [Bacteroidota bacterium]|nr:hypothetical protein [Bacteroidota bacterium]